MDATLNDRNDMTKTIFKAFVVWALFPYISLIVFQFMLQLPRTTVAEIFHYWSPELKVILFCAFEAMIGASILWSLPISKRWLGILTGVVISIVLVFAVCLLEMALFGGFEANVDIAVTALILTVPSCLAGGYAGFLRTQQARN
jgi:predicted permease